MKDYNYCCWESLMDVRDVLQLQLLMLSMMMLQVFCYYCHSHFRPHALAARVLPCKQP
jgi:hypothetical protein